MSLLNPFSTLQTIGIAGIACVAAWGAGELHGHSRGVDAKQAEWNVEKLKTDAALRDSEAKANKIGADYEQLKAHPKDGLHHPHEGG